jgi:hypothetical protein
MDARHRQTAGLVRIFLLAVVWVAGCEDADQAVNQLGMFIDQQANGYKEGYADAGPPDAGPPPAPAQPDAGPVAVIVDDVRRAAHLPPPAPLPPTDVVPLAPGAAAGGSPAAARGAAAPAQLAESESMAPARLSPGHVSRSHGAAHPACSESERAQAEFCGRLAQDRRAIEIDSFQVVSTIKGVRGYLAILTDTGAGQHRNCPQTARGDQRVDVPAAVGEYIGTECWHVVEVTEESVSLQPLTSGDAPAAGSTGAGGEPTIETRKFLVKGEPPPPPRTPESNPRKRVRELQRVHERENEQLACDDWLTGAVSNRLRLRTIVQSENPRDLRTCIDAERTFTKALRGCAKKFGALYEWLTAVPEGEDPKRSALMAPLALTRSQCDELVPRLATIDRENTALTKSDELDAPEKRRMWARHLQSFEEMKRLCGVTQH